jgi:hypothetical protein
MDWIETYPNKLWDWGKYGISCNSFATEKRNFIRKKHCEWFQSHIFEELVSVAFHPSRILFN